MSVGEHRPARRRRVAWVTRAALAALLVGAVGCGGSSGGDPDNEASLGSASPGGSSTVESATSVPVAGPPFPEGVYQWSLTSEDWTAAGLPAETEADVSHHIVTFAGGTAYDVAVHHDGSRQIAAEWRFAPIGDHQVSLTDEGGRSLTLQWEFTGNELRFQMAPDQGEPRDHVLWTAQPLLKVG
jgi:hypothetical protein